MVKKKKKKEDSNSGQLELDIRLPKPKWIHELAIEEPKYPLFEGAKRLEIRRTNPTTGETDRFDLPCQWIQIEALILHREIQGVRWQLADNEYEEDKPPMPPDLWLIHGVLENFVEQQLKLEQLNG